MKLFSVLLIAIVLPLAGCAGMNSGAGVARDFEDVPRIYIVFFAVDSSELDEAARGVIAEAARDSMRFQPTTIQIAGFSGDGPESTVSPALAEGRFSAVANALAAEGLDPSLIARSELVDDPDLPEIAEQRIEIHFELP